MSLLVVIALMGAERWACRDCGAVAAFGVECTTGAVIFVCWSWGLCGWAGDLCGLMVIVLLALRFVFAGVGDCAAGVGIWCGLVVIVLLALRVVFVGGSDRAAAVGIGVGWW